MARKRTRKTRKAAGATAQPPSPPVDGKPNWLTIVGAAHNNLRKINVKVPLGRFVCVTGVSGSGKSSLVNDIIREQLARDLNGSEKVAPGKHKEMRGLEHLDKVIDIDQSPIGRTPRSNPATYIKVFDPIRKLFADMPDSQVRGYKPGRFSFNVPTGKKGGGRCEACEGNGANKVEMDFLADVWVTCPICQGFRFSRETLQIRFKGKTISDVLEMDVQEALEHFQNIPQIASMLNTLHSVGLDYIKLGQSSTTLSGGEAQRIKLARELVKKSTGRTLYLLDEPTTGLHFHDIRKLLDVLHGFVDAGNSVVVIEHNLDVIKTADWVIDLGPEGGKGGGSIVVEGTPEDVAKCRTSYTGKALRPVLEGTHEVAEQSKKKTKKEKTKRHKAVSVVGARQHNLKDVSVDLPRDKTTVFCGPSGSGKSSLAMDTIYTEGQRRYVESLSAYARQFLGQMQKPAVDHVYGLSPSIAIEQKNTAKSPRSTVGTVTEIYDYMRVLWARIGQPCCPDCDIPIGSQTSDEIVARVMELPEGTRIMILAPLEPVGSETWKQALGKAKSQGFLRVRIDGELHELDDPIDIDKRKRHEVEIVIDRALVRKSSESRIADSIEQALFVGLGLVKILPLYGKDAEQGQLLRFSQIFSCNECGRSFEDITPHHFSFNSRLGWCYQCEGLGTQAGADPAAIIIHPTRSILDGAIAGWDELDPRMTTLIRTVADYIGFDPDTPWTKLAERHRTAFLQGTGDEWLDEPDTSLRFRWRGFFPAIDRATRVSWQFRSRLQDMVADVPCETCGGSRLREEAAAVLLNDQSIYDICALPLNKALAFFKKLKLDARQKKIAGELLHEIVARLTFLNDVGLDYVSLHRGAATLSGGESQRIQLASQIGSGLTGVLYVLDEPTIGLHPRDTNRLIAALNHLRDLGNTLLVVEHDRDVIDNADHVLDFGPGAGSEGGEVVAAASPVALRKKRKSLTGKYLSSREAIAVPTNRRLVSPPVELREDDDGHVLLPEATEPDRWLWILGARHNNLRELDVSIPLGRMVAVTGPSGSGKSSLIGDILQKALAARIHRARLTPGGHHRIVGVELIDKVINVDQTPIGSTPASNPATYTGLFDQVRELFAKLPESRVRGYNPNRFSFNRTGGRCEACEGNGKRCIEMHFLPDVWIECETCKGKRYTPETLDVQYRGKSIADVLDMRVSESLEHFERIPKVRRMLQMLDDVGLGYIQLGQSAPTLSGGEAQRVKLAAELGRPQTGKTLYILDEPTTGLHFDDIRKLLKVMHRLVDLGNSVLCIEHNLDVIKTADWIIDLGPEAGEQGGEIVIEGSPETVAKTKASYTGQALIPVLKAGPYAEREVFDPDARAAEELAESMRQAQAEDETVNAALPWESDGKRWHLERKTNRDGKPIEWKADALEWFISTLENSGDFAPTKYNDRATIEIRAKGSKGAFWFAHIMTSGRWLLDISIRTPAGTFKERTLQRQFGIAKLDDRDDIHKYGQDERVMIRSWTKGVEDIRMLIHDLKDVKKTVIKKFLKEAAAANISYVEAQKADPGSAEPWLKDGEAWHLSQPLLEGKKPKWQPTTLMILVGAIKKAAPQIDVHWNNKTAIIFRTPDRKCRFGKISTYKKEGLMVEFNAKPGTVTPAMIENLGMNPTIRNHRGQLEIRFWIAQPTDIDKKSLKKVLDHSLL